jgi:UDPglucose--hexose-1-phosphate uridylyltransferase
LSPVLWDPYTGDPLLVAPSRAGRPHDTSGPGSRSGCPFCEGNEAETPPETLAVRPGGGPPDSPGWLVRAVPNRYPALAPEEGVHEVVISTPRHVVRFSDLTPDEASRAVWAWRERLHAVAADRRRLWPFLFFNQGAAAGASLQHSHAQLVGLPFAPPRLVAREHAFDAAPECPICAEIAGAAERTVLETEHLIAWCPAQPPLSAVVRLAPRDHRPDWGRDLRSEAVAAAVQHVFLRMERGFAAEALNLWLHQRRPGGGASFHWHLEAVPRLGTLAGLELGTGVIAAAHTPEEAAARLREIDVEEVA